LEVAEYTEKKLQEMGFAAWRNPNAITVVFPKPSTEICVKWQLASEGKLSHIICMPGITKEKIDEFLKELK
jgi:histidine decarboxylase